MEIFNQNFMLLTEADGIRLNLDILGSGVINIILLVGILIYFGRSWLGSVLEKRKVEIVNSIKDAEQKVDDANNRLTEAQKQLKQAQIIIGEIRNETSNTKHMLLESDSKQANQDLAIRFSRALTIISSKEQLIFNEVKQEIISLTLKNVLLQLQKKIGTQKQCIFIEKSIIKLGGNLL
jgi:F-type H+-transporting ATPase subunit b